MANEQGVGRTMARIDCTRDAGADRYFACGDVRVVAGTAGTYREAAGEPLSRFGYRFQIEHTGQPHLAIVRYPDDRRRFMTVMDGTCYDLSSGVVTGYSQPLTNTMLELRIVFWPRWRDCSIVFTTWSTGEPAAAASVEIVELDGLPAAPPAAEPAGGGRSFGVQYEDPCGTGASEGAITRAEWLDHVVAYMRHAGMDLLAYPLVWYHGPQIPSELEPGDAFDVVVAPDRRQYCRWTTHPPEWIAPLLERFGAEGLRFQGALTLLRLGSLMRRMCTDPDAARAGLATINNVTRHGDVQTGTGDWTPVYNSRNYPGLLGRYASGLDASGFEWVYGESSPVQSGPIFNPLHPEVQAAVIGFVREIATRYAAYPAFAGLSLNIWHASFLWYGSLRTGYDDATVGRFARETGIEVPGDAADPGRFAVRYDYLTGSCRPAWVAWRCERIRDFLLGIRDTLAAARPDLELTLTVWQETTVPAACPGPDQARQLYARPGSAGLLREGGIDLDLLAGEPGVRVDLEIGNPRDRGGHSSYSTGGAEAPPEAQCMYRDHDFLDADTLGAVRGAASPGAFVFNCWVEAWGQHRWFPCEPGDDQAAGLAQICGEPAEGVFRMNSEYPEDGFWWDSQLRITHGLPGGVHYLEPYAHALAELDALCITRGGLFLDTTHADEVRRFALAYRSLPRVRFDTVGASTDPVAVRTHLGAADRRVYMVNREYYPAAVAVTLDREADVTDVGGGASPGAVCAWNVVLGPYELRSFAMPAAAGIRSVVVTPPADVVRALLAEAEDALRIMAECAGAGRHVPGAERLAGEIRAAIAEPRPAWLRRALGSYIVRKCRQLAGEPIRDGE